MTQDRTREDEEGQVVQKNSDADGDISTGYYVVGLIDLLNQGNQLDRWRRFPETVEENNEFDRAVDDTVRVVHRLRDYFEFVFAKTFGPQEANDPCFSHLNEEEKTEYRRLNSVTVGRQYFSDTTVLFSPLAIRGGDITVQSIYGMILASAGILIDGLAHGVALRGGIEVGIGTEHFSGEIYGPVLRSSYELESCKAKFPRVIVGDECVKFLEECRTNHGKTKATRLNRGYAEASWKLVDRADDDQYFVDYLGRGYRDSLRPDSQQPGLVRRAHHFVKEAHRGFVSAGNEKLADRYERLKQYFDSKMWLWE